MWLAEFERLFSDLARMTNAAALLVRAVSRLLLEAAALIGFVVIMLAPFSS